MIFCAQRHLYTADEYTIKIQWYRHNIFPRMTLGLLTPCEIQMLSTQVTPRMGALVGRRLAQKWGLSFIGLFTGASRCSCSKRFTSHAVPHLPKATYILPPHPASHSPHWLAMRSSLLILLVLVLLSSVPPGNMGSPLCEIRNGESQRGIWFYKSEKKTELRQGKEASRDVSSDACTKQCQGMERRGQRHVLVGRRLQRGILFWILV